MNNMKKDYYTLQVNQCGSVTVYGWDTYPSHSVLAGQARKTFITSYATGAEAEAAYPEANYSNPLMERDISLNHLDDTEGSW